MHAPVRVIAATLFIASACAPVASPDNLASATDRAAPTGASTAAATPVATLTGAPTFLATPSQSPTIDPSLLAAVDVGRRGIVRILYVDKQRSSAGAYLGDGRILTMLGSDSNPVAAAFGGQSYRVEVLRSWPYVDDEKKFSGRLALLETKIGFGRTQRLEDLGAVPLRWGAVARTGELLVSFDFTWDAKTTDFAPVNDTWRVRNGVRVAGLSGVVLRPTGSALPVGPLLNTAGELVAYFASFSVYPPGGASVAFAAEGVRCLIEVAFDPQARGDNARCLAASSTPAPTAPPLPQPIVHTTPLGQVTGNWLFYGVQIPRPERNRVEVQIVAAPVSGGAATTVVTFDAAIPTQGVRGFFDSTPYLRRQFSPDGKRMVLSIDGQLVVIDLVTGQAKPLGVEGFYPSWSRDGSQIAFVFEKDWGFLRQVIGVVPAAGGSPSELAGGVSDGRSVEWSPDGSRILVGYFPPGGCVDACGGHVTMEVASGRIGKGFAWVSGAPSYAHWRVGSPELAVAAQICVRDQLQGSMESARIAGIDERTGSERTLVDVADPCVEVQEPGGDTGVRDRVQLRDPRWSPAVADELLYIAAVADDFETHVVNIRTGKDTRLPISAYEATWTSDGSAVAYLLKTPGSSFGSAVRVWKRDGGGETELHRATAGEAFFSIASVSY